MLQFGTESPWQDSTLINTQRSSVYITRYIRGNFSKGRHILGLRHDDGSIGSRDSASHRDVGAEPDESELHRAFFRDHHHKKRSDAASIAAASSTFAHLSQPERPAPGHAVQHQRTGERR